MSVAGCVTAAFGKLPSQGDFLRIMNGVSGDAAPDRLLDAWFLAGGMDQGRHGDLAARFAASPPTFAIMPHRGRWWALAIFASRDAVDRLHPFTVGVGIPDSGIDEEIGLLPILFAPFFQAAYSAHVNGWPREEHGLRVAMSAMSEGIDLASAQDALVNALENITQSTLWSGLLGDPMHAQRAAVLAAISTVQPVGLRLAPLAHQAHLAFWLMASALLHGRAGIPALVAMHATQPASAMLLFGQPRSELAHAALWPATASASFSAGVLDLAAAGCTPGDIEQRALGDGRDCLRDLLHRLVAHRRTQSIRRSR